MFCFDGGVGNVNSSAIWMEEVAETLSGVEMVVMLVGVHRRL